jgi:hypothetical protein
MEQDEVPHDGVERMVGKRERFDVAAVELQLRMALTGDREHRLGAVEADGGRTPPGGLCGHVARAGSDIEDTLPSADFGCVQ